MRYSIVIPLFNRPSEISELLESLVHQSLPLDGLAEVVVVEDGSTISSQQVIELYSERLTIKYLTKENEGPALARNFGVEHSQGEWLIFLDSDTVMPEGWLEAVDRGVKRGDIDAWGGADRASADFTPVQKAINYSMTSMLTTGGIRGKKKSAEKFHPRSFNMGMKRELFLKVGGFSAMRFGEDIDLSIRLMQAGARTVLLPEAWVYHKRRVDFRKFYRQVRASGVARVWLSKRHRGSLKIVHLFPMCFVWFVVATVVGAAFTPWAWSLLGLWAAMITLDSSVRNGGIEIGILSLVASFVQLWGYGVGFMWGVMGATKNVEKNFYK
ncbi:MAG: glycosyltransferase [Rikenellaceae bacterium]